ncbi:MAG: hypothetical protein ACOY4W_16825 [Thermodesulfobacteriota bacterium]
MGGKTPEGAKRENPTSIRLPAPTREWLLSGLFPSLHAGAASVLNATPRLYLMTIIELRGRFGRDELMAICQVAGRLLPGDQAVGADLLHRIEEELAFGALEDQLETAPATFLAKLRRLSAYQAAVLQWWAGRYQAMARAGGAEEALEKHLAQLLVDRESDEEG